MAERLAPRLLDEASRLLASQLLIVPQSKEFFQACIILGLWPTSVGEAPLSIDSWALTGYALQQTLASPLFANATDDNGPNASASRRDMQFLWNHLALAHLQYVCLQVYAVLSQPELTHSIRPQSLCWHAET